MKDAITQMSILVGIINVGICFMDACQRGYGFHALMKFRS